MQKQCSSCSAKSHAEQGTAQKNKYSDSEGINFVPSVTFLQDIFLFAVSAVKENTSERIPSPKVGI